MKKSVLGPSLLALTICGFLASAHSQDFTVGKVDAVPATRAQGTSAPTPNPSLEFSLWQQSSQSTASSSDVETQFKMWQSQRTSADSINLFKCTTSTDLDSPECVGRLPGTKMTGTKDATIPTTKPVRKLKAGAPD